LRNARRTYTHPTGEIPQWGDRLLFFCRTAANTWIKYRCHKNMSATLLTLLLTIEEAAHELRVSPRTLARMTARGEVRAVRLSPRLVRYSREAIEQMIREQQEVASNVLVAEK
jgi:excisionase family DNA binding protein